jgi:hypothetical protein
MSLSSLSMSWFVRLLFVVASVAGLRAQCNPQWLPGDPIVSPRGTVEAMTSWDPDGAGPAAAVLVAGGSFAVANETTVRVATYDGSQWQRLGGPLPDTCYALTIYNSQLIAVCRNTVHAWNGTAWQTIGTAAGSRLATATVFQGDLFVAGGMTSINGALVANIARWNGTSWFALGTGLTGFVNALAIHTFANGPGLYVGGSFLTAGGLASPNLAVWTGSAWAAPAAPNGTVTSLAVRSTVSPLTSFLFVGGDFTQIGSLAAGQVARLDGLGTWSAMSLAAAPTDFGSVRLVVRAVGQLGYECTAAVDGSVQRWTGAGWNLLGGTTVYAGATKLAIHYHGGRYHAAGRSSTPHVASFDGATWQRVAGQGIDGLVNAVLADGDDAVIAGDFVTISGVTMNGIARGDRNAWLPLGGGVTGGSGQVHAIVRLPDGRIVAGGDFTVLNGAVANRLAVWDGTSWSQLGGGTNGAVWALHVTGDGDLVVGGAFTVAGTIPAARVARWSGVAWSAYGFGIGNGVVYTVGQDAAGRLFAGGDFSMSGSTVVLSSAWWSGTSWSTVFNGASGKVHCSRLAGAEFLAGGEWLAFGGNAGRALAVVTTSTAYPFPFPNPTLNPLAGKTESILPLPNGGLMAGGRNITLLVGPVPVSDPLWRYDPATQSWSYLLVTNDAGRMALALAPNGDVLCTNTVTVGGLVSSGFARLRPTCPATATSYGTACPGAGGPLTLRATSLPWLRTTYRAETTGFAPNMVGLAGMGFAPVAVPLPLLVPGSGPCDLLVDPVLLTPVLPVGGVGAHAVVMPTSLAFVGASLFEQVVALAFAPDGSISGLHGSNGLQLALGALY